MKADAIIGAVEGVTKKWMKQRKREERDASAQTNRRYAMTRRNHVSIKEAAWQVMQTAYNKASANGTLPAHARQVMYAARGFIQRNADRTLGDKFDQYFTQTLLPDYIAERGVTWNVVYDPRGHFIEPHTDKTVPLGTLQVRDYLSRVRTHAIPDLDFTIEERHYPTIGPKNRFGAILFIEKEGFHPLFEKVKLAERYDIAIMSTKGMSVTASRELIDQICDTAAKTGVPLLVLHDFDKAGFSILGTLHRSARRYEYRNAVQVVDLGLRIEDIAGLETEDVFINSPETAEENLRENGATEEEVEFLLERRVEINAFASDQLIQWIEGKLEEHGVAKVIPAEEVLADAYRRMRLQALMQQRIDEIAEELGDENCVVPANLKDQIRAGQRNDRTLPWDAMLQEIAKADHEGSES
jgi:hypothetical protein